MKNRALGMFFRVVGVIALMIAGIVYLRQQQFLARALPANGVVTDIRTSVDDGDETYAPVVSFRTQAGSDAVYKSTIYTRPSGYKVGDRVVVLYNPEKPEDALIKGRAANSLVAIIVGGIGVVFVIVGLGARRIRSY